MKKILVSIFLTVTPFICQAAEPSQESIEKLLAATQSQKLVEGMIPQIEGMMKSIADKAIDTQKMTPEQREKAIALNASMTKKMIPIMKEQLSWENLKKVYIPIYRESFSQEEIDGLISFYGSPAGKAMVEKMPVVMQKTMVAMQQMMGPMMQEVQKAAAEAAEEAKHSADGKQ